MAVLKFKDNLGAWHSIPAIQGASAYEQAVDGGYTGTLEDFYLALKGVDAAVQAAEDAEDSASAAAASALQLAAGVASPAGTYADLAALNAGTPTAPDVSKIYLTLNDGKWCYHNGSTFVAGEVYQATAVPDGAITPLKMNVLSYDYLDDANLTVSQTDGKYINDNGTLNNSATLSVGEAPVTEGKYYHAQFYSELSTNTGCNVIFFNALGGVLIPSPIYPYHGYTLIDDPTHIYRVKAPNGAVTAKWTFLTATGSYFYEYKIGEKVAPPWLANPVPISDIAPEAIDWHEQDLNVTIGYYVNNGGNLAAYSPATENAVSDFIPVVAGETIKYIGYTETAGYYNGAIFNAAQVKLANLDAPASAGSEASMVMPEGAAFVRLNISKLYSDSYLKRYYVKKYLFPNIQLSEDNIPVGLIDTDQIADGAVTEAKLSSTVVDSVVSAAVAEITGFGGDISPEALVYAGLTSAWIGDSITAGAGVTTATNRYSKVVVDTLNMSVAGYQNLGVSGSCVAKEDAWAVKSFVERVVTDDDVDAGKDLIFILCGVNDFVKSHALASQATALAYKVSNSVWNDYDFTGALNHIVEYLRANHTGSTIVFIPTIHYANENTANTESKVLANYIDVMKDVAKHYSIPVIDLFGECVLDFKDSYISDNYSSNGWLTAPDGIHPNDAGNIIIAKKIIKDLKHKIVLL